MAFAEGSDAPASSIYDRVHRGYSELFYPANVNPVTHHDYYSAYPVADARAELGRHLLIVASIEAPLTLRCHRQPSCPFSATRVIRCGMWLGDEPWYCVDCLRRRMHPIAETSSRLARAYRIENAAASPVDLETSSQPRSWDTISEDILGVIFSFTPTWVQFCCMARVSKRWLSAANYGGIEADELMNVKRTLIERQIAHLWQHYHARAVDGLQVTDVRIRQFGARWRSLLPGSRAATVAHGNVLKEFKQQREFFTKFMDFMERITLAPILAAWLIPETLEQMTAALPSPVVGEKSSGVGATPMTVAGVLRQLSKNNNVVGALFRNQDHLDERLVLARSVVTSERYASDVLQSSGHVTRDPDAFVQFLLTERTRARNVAEVYFLARRAFLVSQLEAVATGRGTLDDSFLTELRGRFQSILREQQPMLRSDSSTSHLVTRWSKRDEAGRRTVEVVMKSVPIPVRTTSFLQETAATLSATDVLIRLDPETGFVISVEDGDATIGTSKKPFKCCCC